MSTQLLEFQNFIQQFSLDDALRYEEQDSQFISLQSARGEIQKKFGSEKNIQDVFLRLVVQNALVSYQLAGTGPQRRAEFSDLIVADFDLLRDHEKHTERRRKVFTTSRYNCRLYNLRHKRTIKLHQKKSSVFEKTFWEHYHDMVSLNQTLAALTQQKFHSKTVTFATKMFGYASRIVYGKIIYYPREIPIPVDSRLTKIYQTLFPRKMLKENEIQDFFGKLLDTQKIPPLHGDVLIRQERRGR